MAFRTNREGKNHDSRSFHDSRQMRCSPRLAHKAPVMQASATAMKGEIKYLLERSME